MHIIQFSQLGKDETLDTQVDYHKAGVQDKIPDNLGGLWSKARLVISAVNGDQELAVYDGTFTNISTVDLIMELENRIRGYWTPGFDPDIIIGAGTTVTLED